MPRYLLSLFVALAAPFLMATSCTIPRDTVQGSSALCAALNLSGAQQDLMLGCVSNDFYKSAKDGKWYSCFGVDAGLFGAMEASRCMNDPAHQVSEENGKILDAWAAGNTGSSTPPVTDPVLTDTPTTTSSYPIKAPCGRSFPAR